MAETLPPGDGGSARDVLRFASPLGLRDRDRPSRRGRSMVGEHVGHAGWRADPSNVSVVVGFAPTTGRAADRARRSIRGFDARTALREDAYELTSSPGGDDGEGEAAGGHERSTDPPVGPAPGPIRERDRSGEATGRRTTAEPTAHRAGPGADS
jgi:hypothetical protein